MYMSPEQAQGRHADLDARSDLCALGLILFELVTLQRPFTATKVDQVIQQAATGERSPIVHAWREAIPSELTAIIERATRFEPVRRYTGVRALADDLRRYLRGEAVEARPDSMWQTMARRMARHRQGMAVALGVLLLSVVALAVIASLVWRHERVLEAQSFREHYRQAFVNDVAQQGDRLQTRLLEVRGELEALAAVVSQAAQHAEKQAIDIGSGEATVDGADPRTRGSFRVLPGAARADAAALAARLHNIGVTQRDIIEIVQQALGSHTAASVNTRSASGLHHMVFGFDAGLAYVYPAVASTRGLPDPRSEPWYRGAEGVRGVDIRPVPSPGLVADQLAMSLAMRDDHGKTMGAVSLMLSLDNVLTNLLAERAISRVHGTWILAHDGRVLAAHADSPEKAAALLRQVPLQELLRAVERRDVGFVETTVNGKAEVVAFDRIHPFEWTLLELAPDSELAADARRP
jgi:serine/threonine-protein kinase